MAGRSIPKETIGNAEAPEVSGSIGFSWSFSEQCTRDWFHKAIAICSRSPSLSGYAEDLVEVITSTALVVLLTIGKKIREGMYGKGRQK